MDDGDKKHEKSSQAVEMGLDMLGGIINIASGAGDVVGGIGEVLGEIIGGLAS